jgi:serine/threonine protein kinase
MQYYPHGSLFDLLKRAKRGDRSALRELDWPKRLEMARDVAAGMQFLHKRGVVHGDLRCGCARRNVRRGASVVLAY